MNAEVSRQRGLGVVALLVLGGVVWLVLFGGDPEPVVDLRSQVPPAPELTPFEVEEPQPPAHIEPVDTALIEPGPSVPEPTAEVVAQPQSADGDAENATPAAQPEPGLDARGLPEAWVVQVASLGNADNATRLRDRLREQGFKAYTETVATANGSATRVLVGPKLSREQAERDKSAIDKAFGLDSLVSRFDPSAGR